MSNLHNNVLIFFFVVKQRLLFGKLARKNKRTIVYCPSRKNYIAKNEHTFL